MNGATINADFAAAINQLAANKTTIMTQIAALSFTQEPAQHTRRFVAGDAFQVPPIQQLTIPTQQAPFQAGAFRAGWGGCQGGRNRGRGCGGRGCTPFADYMCTTGAMPATPGRIVLYGRGNTQPLLGQGGVQHLRNPDYSNIYKQYNNWNVCFLCGFEVEDGHTSLTCPFRKVNHQSAFTQENAQQFIAVGYDPSTKGMHKMVLPLGRGT